MQWIPGGGVPLKVLKRNDSIMRGLADAYGLTDMRSARAGESVAPRPSNNVHGQAGTYNAIPGVEVPLNHDVNGNITGGCTQVSLPKDMQLPNLGPAQPKLPHISQKTHIEARWSRDKGEQAT